MTSTPSRIRGSPDKGSIRQNLSPSALSQSRYGHRNSLSSDGAISPGLGASAFHPNARIPPRTVSSQSMEVLADAPIKVVVRVRPPLQPSDPGFDLIPVRRQRRVVNALGEKSVSVDTSTGSKEFIFDHVFEELDRQEFIGSYLSDSVGSFLKGYNVSLLAYGQSGSGKSYTMGTCGPDEQSSSLKMGIIPRAVQALFASLPSLPTDQPTKNIPTPFSSSSAVDRAWTMQVSYVEIYNEIFHDLLASDLDVNERPLIDIRESKGQIKVGGLRQRKVDSVEDILRALNEGSAIRQTDATTINSKSSRSHAIFTLILTQRKEKPLNSSVQGLANPSNPETVAIQSKMHFVDLAGSERMKNTNSTGDRAKEGISINSGLASLGKVISQLSSNPRGSHVSYRDSKLTRMLTDSLGGNSITYFVACLAPQEYHQAETLNTLQYAQRARAIQSRPKIHQLQDEEDLRSIIEKLRAENYSLRQRTGSAFSEPLQVDDGKSTPNNEKALNVPTRNRDSSDTHTLVQRRLDYHTIQDDTSASMNSGSKDATATLQEAWSLISHYERTIRSLKRQVSSSKLDRVYAEQQVEKLKHDLSLVLIEKENPQSADTVLSHEECNRSECISERSNLQGNADQFESALAASKRSVSQLREQLDEANKERRFKSFGNIELESKCVQTNKTVDQVQPESPSFQELSTELQSLKEENRILQCLRISPVAINESNLSPARLQLSEQPSFSPSSQLLIGSSNSKSPSNWEIGDCYTNGRPVFSDISAHKQNARELSLSDSKAIENTSKNKVLSSSSSFKLGSLIELDDVLLKRQGSLDTATRRVKPSDIKLKSSLSLNGQPSNYTPKTTATEKETGLMVHEIEAIERSSKPLALQLSSFASPGEKREGNVIGTANTIRGRLQNIQSVVEKASITIQAMTSKDQGPTNTSANGVAVTKSTHSRNSLNSMGQNDRQHRAANKTSDLNQVAGHRASDNTRARKFRVR